MASQETQGLQLGPEKTTAGVNVHIRESNSIEHVNEKHDVENCEHVQWQPGFWKRFPWIGFAAIMTMLACIAMDGVILGTSRWQYREEWPAHQKWEFVSEKWRKKSQIEPHVLLAIVNTVTNVALGVAIGHGVAIAWWRRVLKGSTIEDLHRSWSFSASVLELVTAGKWFNYIALAALMAKVALIDNVLLQQAVSTSPGYFWQESMNLSLPMAKALPQNYAGVISDDDDTMAVSWAWSWDMYNYEDDVVINSTDIYNTEDIIDDWRSRGYDTGCIGFCDAAFQGFGFEWDCALEEVSKAYNVTPGLAQQNSPAALKVLVQDYLDKENLTEADANATLTKIFESPLQMNPVLAVASDFIPRGQTAGDAALPHDVPAPYNNRTFDTGVIALQFQYSRYNQSRTNVSLCTGLTYTQFCVLKPATVNYTLEITNVTKTTDKSDQKILEADNGITLIDSVDKDFSDPKYEKYGDLPVDGQFQGYDIVGPAYQPYDPTKHDSNLKFVESWLESSFSTIMLMEWINKTGYAPNMNPAGSIFSGANSAFGSYWVQFDPSEYCGLDQQSPLAYIANNLNNLMVRASMHAATTWLTGEGYSTPDESAIQRHQQGQSLSSLYYTTDWAFGGAAMGVIFFCVLCILPSYYGFWQLGRKVTLGPIEVAGAFQAPVMQHPTVATNGEVDQFVKDIGQRRVRYGQVEGEQRLAVAPPTEVVRPGT